MVLLIARSTHTGKTCFAQKLMERSGYTYLSIDHVKMGLIRSGQTDLTPEDDTDLTEYLWPIVREIIKTVIENRQHIIIEGCYIPFGWEQDFEETYREQIRYVCLIMTPEYIRHHFASILQFASRMEMRPDDEDLQPDALIQDNQANWEQCRRHGYEYIWIDNTYQVDMDL